MSSIQFRPSTHPQSPSKPKAIIFDLLTALLDSWTLWDSCAGSPALGRRWRAKYLDITFSCGAYQQYEDLVHQAARETPDLPQDAPDQLVERWDTLTPWAEVPDVLQRLRRTGYKIGVITNCSTVLGRRAAGICESEDFAFDVVLTAEEVGFYKPDARAYAAPVAALGIDASECVFVAGSAGDVVGATKAGMRVLWHNRIGLERKKGENGEVVMPEVEGRELAALLEDDGVL